jgi:integrase
MTNSATRTKVDLEPDLTVLIELLDSATYEAWRPSLADWMHRRNAAMVALAWLVGMPIPEMLELRVRDWRPGKREVVAIRAAERFRMFRERRQPILDVARDRVGDYLRAVPFEMPGDGPLVRRVDRKGIVLSDIFAFNKVLNRVSGGTVPNLTNLTNRFRGYVERTVAQDGTIEHLVGRSGHWDHLEPTTGQLRRALAAAHPLGRGMPQPNRQPLITGQE